MPTRTHPGFSTREGVHIASDPLDLFDPGSSRRNFDPGAVDVGRARELGTATLNQTRVTLGLTAYTDFSQITQDAALAAKLQSVYGSVDKIDLFVGGLAETPVAGSMVGQTFEVIMVDRFQNLHAGDRLLFSDQDFSADLMKQIETITLSDLILRDPDTAAIQAKPFIADLPGVSDTIVAGAGLHQVLKSGSSTDTFVFLGAGHDDIGTGVVHGIDKLGFENMLTPPSFHDVRLGHAADGEALVQVVSNALHPTGVSASSVTANDFLFNHINPVLMTPSKM